MPTNLSCDELEKRIHYLERKKNELGQSIETLRKKESIFQFFYDKAPVAYQSLDANGRIIDVNDAWLTILGYDRNEVIGKSFGDFIHPDWQTHFKENFPRFKAVGEVLGVEFEMLKKNGSFLIASFSGMTDTDSQGCFNKTFCFFEDVTELTQTKAAFQKSEETARALLNASTESAFLIDLEGTIIDMNEITAKRLKKNAADLIGNICYDYLPPNVAQSRKQMVQEVLKKKKPIRFEDIRDGMHFDHHVYPVFNSEGEVFRLAVFAKDITRQKKSEKELILKNRLSNVILTAAGVQMYSEILSMILEELHSKFGYLGYIDDNGDLACPSLTHDVWDQCRIEGKTAVFPQSSWGGLWGRSLQNKTMLYSNHPLHPPGGHVPLTRAIVCPIIHNSQLIGQIAVANKLTDYSETDLTKIKNIALFMAPILATRLEKNKIERKHTEKQVVTMAKEWQTTFDTTSDAIFLLDKDMRIKRANRKAIQLFKSFDGNIVGRYCHAVVHDTDQPITGCPNKQAMLSLRRESMELEMGKNWFKVTVDPFIDNNGKYAGGIHIIADITERKKSEQEREKLINDLKQALKEIKTLSGLIPICAVCKKIRDDKGYWNLLESYIQKHSDASFSHSMCPECSDKLYGDQDWYIEMKKKKNGE